MGNIVNSVNVNIYTWHWRKCYAIPIRHRNFAPCPPPAKNSVWTPASSLVLKAVGCIGSELCVCVCVCVCVCTCRPGNERREWGVGGGEEVVWSAEDLRVCLCW